VARPLQSVAAVRFGILAVTAALGVSSGCAVFTGPGCTDHQDSTWNVQEPTNPSATIMIEDCRDDVDACTDLCTTELDQNASGVDIVQMTGCQVRFDGSTVHVEVKYDTASDSPGCDQPEPIEAPGTGGETNG
jgi:hypothetical protein